MEILYSRVGRQLRGGRRIAHRHGRFPGHVSPGPNPTGRLVSPGNPGGVRAPAPRPAGHKLQKRAPSCGSSALTLATAVIYSDHSLWPRTTNGADQTVAR